MKKEAMFLIGFLGLTVIFTTMDVAADLAEGTSWDHVLLEIAVILVGGAGLVWVLVRWLSDYRSHLRQSERDLQSLQLQAETWKKEAQSLLQGLASQIDRQMTQWDLTPAEKEVALYLVKGFSQKEIALFRGVQEKTVRLQCSSVYKKSGVAGRAELAAFFLEDLLLPNAQRRGD